jgi:hypothetical protein
MMITAITPESPVSGTHSLSDYRYRPTMGERTVLPDSAPATPKNSTSSNNDQFPQGKRQTPPQPEPPRRDSSSMFAAAVIAGALSPTPKTMEELMMRIGTSTIPEESEARLKDLLA